MTDEQLKAALIAVEQFRNQFTGNSFWAPLHGPVNGIADALRVIFTEAHRTKDS